MPKLQIISQSEMPEHLKWQILSFFRMEWPDGASGDDKYRDWLARDERHLVGVVVSHDKLLISFAGVVWKMLEHAGQSYKVYGLSGVFTYPSFRHQGYGAQVVTAARDYIDQTDGDLVIFTSGQKGFYEKLGFLAMPGTTLPYGNKNKLELRNEMTYMRFLSAKGCTAQASFENTSIYFGTDIW